MNYTDLSVKMNKLKTMRGSLYNLCTAILGCYLLLVGMAYISNHRENVGSNFADNVRRDFVRKLNTKESDASMHISKNHENARFNFTDNNERDYVRKKVEKSKASIFSTIPYIPYSLSPICKECSTSYFCMEKIFKKIKNKGSSLLQASQEVSLTLSESCAECNPNSCPNGVKYWRYDHIAPEILVSKSYFLPSIPRSRRIPEDQIETADKYFKDLVDAKEKGMLFEYNPTLVQIPDSMLRYLNVKSNHIPTYLASFRVTARSSCFRRNVTDAMDPTHLKEIYKDSYLGLALLTDDLTMIPETDVVIDLNSELRKRTRFVDYRLFNVNQKIYLNINPPPVKLTEISISTSPTHEYDESFKKVKNLFGNGLFVTVHHDLNTIHGKEGTDKNFALFQAKGHNKDEILAQLRPLDPHIVKQINPKNTSVLDCAMIKRTDKESRLCNSYSVYERELSGNITEDDASIKPSFMNIHNVVYDKEVMSKARGGACCVKINDPRSRENDYLLVGMLRML